MEFGCLSCLSILTNCQNSYNDPTKHRHGQLPPLQRVKLEGLASRLKEVRASPWFLHRRWSEITGAVDDLIAGLVKYCSYLESTSSRIYEMHAMIEPMGTSSALERREAQVRDSGTAARYAA